MLMSEVEGFEGPCKPTWINRNLVHIRSNDITGFFRLVKKRWGFYFKTGKEFHGIIGSSGHVYSTEIEDLYNV